MGVFGQGTLPLCPLTTNYWYGEGAIGEMLDVPESEEAESLNDEELIERFVDVFPSAWNAHR